MGTSLVADSESDRGGFWRHTGSLLLVICLTLSFLSTVDSFEHGQGHEERPILLVLAFLAVASVLYFVAAVRAFRSPPGLWLVLGSSILFRLVLLPSTPIQEDDIYRYIWDGKVAANGLDPFLHSPQEVLQFDPEEAEGTFSGAKDLIRLERLSRRSPHNRVILERVNNEDLATIYPLLTQLTFAVHGHVVPDRWDVGLQITAMKTLFFFFDLGTLVVLIVLLKAAGKPPGLSVLYGWCPLVLKEFSNSGHMDAIPCFFLSLALLCALLVPGGPTFWQDPKRVALAFLAALALAAAVNAKFFAALLVPLLWRRLGWRWGTSSLIVCGALAVAGQQLFPESAYRRAGTTLIFALTWENNAAVFLWVEKLFGLVTGDSSLLCRLAGELYRVELSVLLARALVGVIAVALAFGLAARTRPSTAPALFLRRCFLVLAGLFLIGPLGFPWYFAWCVPLLPFVRGRSWLLLPGLLMVYYLRFWYDYNYGVAGFESSEDALEFFDHALVTVEFALFYVVAGFELLRGKPWRKQNDS